MSATDELRRLLDERGVKYRWYNGTATWYVDGVMYNAWGYNKERLTMSVCHLTPAQAIAATLGRGTCQLERADWDDGTCTWGCICTACDAHLEHETGIGYNYCPICGARVVRQ